MAAKYKRVNYGNDAPTEGDIQSEYKKGYMLVSVVSSDIQNGQTNYYGYFVYTGGQRMSGQVL